MCTTATAKRRRRESKMDKRYANATTRKRVFKGHKQANANRGTKKTEA